MAIVSAPSPDLNLIIVAVIKRNSTFNTAVCIFTDYLCSCSCSYKCIGANNKAAVSAAAFKDFKIISLYLLRRDLYEPNYIANYSKLNSLLKNPTLAAEIISTSIDIPWKQNWNGGISILSSCIAANILLSSLYSFTRYS